MKTNAKDSNRVPLAAVINQPYGNSSRLRRGKFFLLALLGAGSLAMHAHANALTGYYTQVALGDPDFGGGANAGGSILPSGLVQSQLGPDGLPVLSAAGITRLGTTSDMNSITHELLWWSPSTDPYVSRDLNPVEVDSMPISVGYPNPWYPTGQTSDSNFYRTVHWEGTFDMASAGTISLSMSVDDDAWVFIDGTLDMEDHYGSSATSNPVMSAGVHSVDIFYDDRIPTYDALNFTSSVAFSPVPEPSEWALIGFGAIAVGIRRFTAKRA